MERINYMKIHFKNSASKGKKTDVIIQECLNRLKTYSEKNNFLDFVEKQK